MSICNVCFRHCNISEGGLGFCGARTCDNGEVKAANYGRVTSLALDPIEKKPLARFHPGSYIVSVGSYGCNLRCPFCQNYQISWSDEARRLAKTAEYIPPEELAAIAAQTKNRGNVGVAFTYNEPLIGWEYIRDTAKLVHEQGMYSVIVTNGTASLDVLAELTPHIDAMNIDLKGFTDRYYNDVLGGDRAMTMAFIEEAAKHCHVELTTLIVPGENDIEDEIREMCAWISSLTDANGCIIGKEIPLHISRFFPRFNMTDRRATDVGLIYRLVEVAREQLTYVYTGNC
ncbi:MAG: AmmeMemoRadiSam system radical SAM enzyme [Clostridiales bacterium]|nr:AmmeMemoRadiSam system radical SAM enzyme [Clostridiales bacterium]